MKKLLPFITVCISFGLFSFYPSPVPRSLSHYKKNLNKNDLLNSTLYPLYIENTRSNPQLGKLLRLEKRGFFTNRFNKIVFQFFYQNDQNGFSLTAYVGKRTNRTFDSTVQFTSYTNSCSGQTSVDIGPNIYLGDIELVDQKAAIKKLEALSPDSSQYKYIIFKPALETQTTNAITRVSVNYKLYAVSSLTDICNINDAAKSSYLNVTVIPVSGNPSPPHGGN
ncbi:MAG TPA: hypothetical protein VK772_13140 [Puia sp.]|jgi:hypothetical protein|nr:hypothetical protein [Puia sp.]